MTGKLLAALIVITAVVAGAGMYYLQVYHFYEVVRANGQTDIRMVLQDNGQDQDLFGTPAYADFQAIDANSSPIRYRACFTTPISRDELSARYESYAGAVPLLAPKWFDCFDAQALGAALETGRATAYLGTRDVIYGIDRVVAVDETGRGYVWHQINRCGEIVFDGNRAPDDCPQPPEGY